MQITSDDLIKALSHVICSVRTNLCKKPITINEIITAVNMMSPWRHCKNMLIIKKTNNVIIISITIANG